MTQNPTHSRFVQTNGIQLHYLDHAGDGPLLVLMHGLTANAHCLDGLIDAGLSPQYRVISIDLRGRGLSDQPETGYDMATHAQDIIGLLDALDIPSAILGGHSFGALLTLYIAKHYPKRVDQMLLLDAAGRMHPDTKTLLKPTLSRLEKSFTSFDAYLRVIQQMPFLENAWDNAMTSYYQADIKVYRDGVVAPRPQAQHMLEAVEGALNEPWLEYLPSITQAGLLINATGAYGSATAPPLLPKELAMETVQALPNGQYVGVSGNHQTMLYGEGAQEILAAINEFIEN